MFINTGENIMSEDTNKESFMKRFWRKKNMSKEKVKAKYPIDGNSFDESTAKGIDNSLSRKAINRKYKWNKVGYFGVTSISIAASVWGGWQLGVIYFILMAMAVELVKLLLPSNATEARVLASTFSFVIGCFAFYMALQHGNITADNQGKSEKMLIASIDSIDLQLKNLGEKSIKRVSSVTTVRFDTVSYNKLIDKIATKTAELDRLKRERHTYWQRVPNKRNRRTGAWMLANPDKCKGSFCKTLNAKVAHIDGLRLKKSLMDKEKGEQLNAEKLAIQAQREASIMEQEREATAQRLMKTRAEYQSKLLNINENVVMEQPIVFIMFLVGLFLLLIEWSQGNFKESSEILVEHKDRINMLYKNFETRSKMKLEKQKEKEKEKKSSWFNKSQPVVEPKKKKNNVSQRTILDRDIAEKIKKSLDSANTTGNKYTRAKCFEEFEKYGVGKTQTNFESFKKMMDIK